MKKDFIRQFAAKLRSPWTFPLLFLIVSSNTALSALPGIIRSGNYAICAVAILCWAAFIFMLKEASSGPVSRKVLFVFLGFNLIAGIFLSIMGEPITLDSILFLWNERSYADSAVQTYWRYAILPEAGFLILTAALFFSVKKTRNATGLRKYLYPAAAVYIAVSGIIISELKRPLPELLPPPIVIPLLPVSAISFPVSSDLYANEAIPFPGTPISDKIVFIIDESIRGDYIDINNMRGTTPYLLSIRDRIINFGIASSSANSSNSSNAILRYGLTPEIINSSSRGSMFSRASIFRFAKRAGYSTVYIDCQKQSGLQNYMTKDEVKDIDYFFQTNKLRTGKIKGDEAFNDTNAAKKANDILKQNGKQFILINKKGCHFHYARSFPETQKIFQPCMVWEEPVNSREKLINTYKNGIRWSVDTFFKILLEKNDLHDVTVFYTSDHGQNLLDDGMPATHCRYRTATPNEARVPLFVITGNATAANRLRKSAEADFNHASGFQLNSTILSFMGYPLDYAESRSGESLFSKYNGRRFFFAGNIRYGRPIEIGFE
jgi:glucan phosphoethanolaminetransferase (alkaline phosphatase superfamily)